MRDLILQPLTAVVWLTFAFGAVTYIGKLNLKLGYKIAAWIAVAELYAMLNAAVFGRGYYPDSYILLFAVSGGIAAHAISTEIHFAMTRTRDAAIVAVLGIGFLAMFCLSLFDWATVGGWQAKAFTAVGLVGMMALANSVWGRLFA